MLFCAVVWLLVVLMPRSVLRSCCARRVVRDGCSLGFPHVDCAMQACLLLRTQHVD